MPSLNPHIDSQGIFVLFDPSRFEGLAPTNLSAFFSDDFLE